MLNKKWFLGLALVVPAIVLAQSSSDKKITSYILELTNQSGQQVLNIVRNINPQNFAASDFSNTTQQPYISNCLKTKSSIENETSNFAEGSMVKARSENGEPTLHVTFKKLLGKNKLNLGDCEIDDVTADEVNFETTLPILEMEQKFKTTSGYYTLVIKQIRN